MVIKYSDGKISGAKLGDGKTYSARNGSDAEGWKRGEKGFARSKGDEEFIGHKGDSAKIYGFSRGDGHQGDPEEGKLKDRFKGAKGLDSKGGGTP